MNCIQRKIKCLIALQQKTFTDILLCIPTTPFCALNASSTHIHTHTPTLRDAHFPLFFFAYRVELFLESNATDTRPKNGGFRRYKNNCIIRARTFCFDPHERSSRRRSITYNEGRRPETDVRRRARPSSRHRHRSAANRKLSYFTA